MGGWAYAALIIGLSFVLLVAADRWWLATVLMYGPRWVWAVPLPLLFTVAGLAGARRTLLPLLVAALVVLFPLMRLCLSVPSTLSTTDRGGGGRSLRVLTCNADHRSLDTAAFGRLIADVAPDIVLMQGWTSRHDTAFDGDGWHTRRDGELYVASRYPISDGDQSDHSSFRRSNGSLARYRIAAQPLGSELTVVNVHFATPREGLTAIMRGGWRGAAQVRADTVLRRAQSAVAGELVSRTLGPVVVAGDFNMPTDSAIYRAHWGRWTNAFSAAGLGFGYTHFTRLTQIRIDHVLASPGWHVERCWVGPDVGADHRPVVADLRWAGHD